ncbi:MAG: CapA family protein [Bacteroidota bacterium]
MKTRINIWYIFVLASFFPVASSLLRTGKPSVDGSGASNRTENVIDTTLTLFFVGDLMGHEPMINAARISGTDSFDYKPWFQYLKPFVDQSDYSIVNLEVTLGGTPYSGYPTFSSPDAYARDVRDIGFDMFITANNHSLDRGQKGLERTIDVLNKFNIDHTGTFKNQNERNESYPFIKEFYGRKLAFLNCTYGTNGLKVQAPNIVNMIDTAEIRKDVSTARQKGAEFIVFTVHWGSEYQRNESSEQARIAQWLADNGVDAIIGMHPHVIQPMKMLHPKNDPNKNVPVAYSLGNFVSNQRERYKDGGIGVKLSIKITENTISFSTWEYVPFWIHRGGTKYGYYAIPASYYENHPADFVLNSTEQSALEMFITDTRKHLSNVEEWKLDE